MEAVEQDLTRADELNTNLVRFTTDPSSQERSNRNVQGHIPPVLNISLRTLIFHEYDLHVPARCVFQWRHAVFCEGEHSLSYS